MRFTPPADPALDMHTNGCTVRGPGFASPLRRCPKEPNMAGAQSPRTRYRSIVADSVRWDGFVFRPGDLVISTPPKSGTTWTQMLCALLIFDGPQFPAPLDEVSPWLDMCISPLAAVTASLDTQTPRRFI